jgi:ferredoxin-NADP reductase
MAVTWHIAELIETRVITPKFRVLRFKVVDNPEWTFVPGQFVLMRMGSQDKVNDYSPCSLPGSGIMETLVDVSPADLAPPRGEGSRFIKQLQNGDRVEFVGAAGNFVYRDDGAKILYFVATGSGISSLWSMILSRLQKEDKRPIKLFWGLRSSQDLIWKEELAELASNHKNFSYEYILSDPDLHWDGKRGYVTEYVLSEVRSKAPLADQISFYLCGNNAMITDLSGGLQNLGFGKERIYFEKYF